MVVDVNDGGDRAPGRLFGNEKLNGLSGQIRQRAQELGEAIILGLLFRQKALPPSVDGRHIPLEVFHEKPLIDERRGYHYISNNIRSSRYTIYDFVPKQLIFQATRLSNFYFICIGIPQAIPGFSTTGNVTTILPLLFFILLTVAKEGYDDYRRHRLDKVENLSTATVLRRADHVGRGKVFNGYYGFPLLTLTAETSTKIVEEEIGEESETEEDEQVRWTKIQWRDIGVGDILKLRRDDPVPADIVLLHTDGEDGIAYVETMALDGETNLKSRQAPSSLRECCSINGIRSCHAEFVLEDPNQNLYSFEGRLSINGQTLPLNLNEVVYRGSVLRNTECVIGLVINTGEECKIRMNANQHPKAKKPRLEHFTNQVVLTLVVYVIVLSVGCSMGYLIWQKSTEQFSWYLNDAAVDFKDIIIGFAIEFNNVIPLALYVSLEIVKVVQMLMVNNDIEMYDEASNTPMRCNTNTILENLGQVNYILTDKTGTLTENVMKFRKMSVSGIVWSHQEDTGGDPNEYLSERCATAEKPLDGTGPAQTTSELINQLQLNPESPFSRKARDLILAMALCNTCRPEVRDGQVSFQGSSPDEVALIEAARDLGYVVVSRTSQFITLLIRDRNGNTNRQVYEILDIIDFSSQRKRMSIIVRRPDGRIWLICKGADSVLIPLLKDAQAAMRQAEEVRQSREQEREFVRQSTQIGTRNDHRGRPNLAVRKSSEKQKRSASIDIRPLDNVVESDEILHQSNLENQTKSTLCSHAVELDTFKSRVPHAVHATSPNQHKFVLLDAHSIDDDSAIFAPCFKHLNNFATEGLRTLLFTHKTIPAEIYTTWKKQYQDATTSLTNRQECVEAAGELIEQSLDLLGASAIEDKLQVGVPETIERLSKADCRIWMLTGDKRETAINIAHSAGICRPSSDVFVLDSSKGDLAFQLVTVVDDMQGSPAHAVAVIDGHTLAAVEASQSLKTSFYSLIPTLDSVICCRASPAQKANIVRAIREQVSGALTLAIGDGANDIAMIQASHVGIGISGKEGLQASRVADYSIAQFRFLARLLLVHGRWNYVRTAKFILLTFWKEMFFYMMQALYQRYNGYTGTSLYENWSLTALNTLFTSLCVIIGGVWEQDLQPETLLAVPELYKYGQRNGGLNIWKYLRWTVSATAEGMIVWFVCWAAYTVPDRARDDGLFAFGDLVFSVAIMWTNWKLLLINTHHKTIIVLAAFSITVAGWWAWNSFLSGVYAPQSSPYDARGGLSNTFGKDPVWWLTLVLIIGILVTLEIFGKALKRSLVVSGLWRWPLWSKGKGSKERDEMGLEEQVEVWQEIERDSRARARLKRAAKARLGDRRDQ